MLEQVFQNATQIPYPTAAENEKMKFKSLISLLLWLSLQKINVGKLREELVAKGAYLRK